MVCQQTHKTILNYHLDTGYPHFIYKMADYIKHQQRPHSIQSSVTLYQAEDSVNIDRMHNGVGHHIKNRSFSS